MDKGKTAAVFPGQGTQRPGMGKDFYDNIAESQNAYAEASDALGWDVAALCFGDGDRMNLTEYAQPCILATEIAMYRGLQARYGFNAEYFGGHSLGEYTALVAAGAMPFADALKTVQARGRLMQQASPPGSGAMAAVITENLDADMIRRVLEGLPMDVANINSADQVVISGRADCIDIASDRLRGAMDPATPMRIVSLNVSAPFHSRFMATIREAFRDILDSVSARLDADLARRVTSNVTGRFHSGSVIQVIEALVAQISSSVNWRDNMQALAGKAGQIYEIGPNRPLRNFFASIGVNCRSITTLSAAVREFA